MLSKTIALVIATSLLLACVSEPLPVPASTPMAVALEQGVLTRELIAAEHRYARGIECGTNYMFEMRDLAKQAPDHLPELVDSFRTGIGARHARIIIYLMNERGT